MGFCLYLNRPFLLGISVVKLFLMYFLQQNRIIVMPKCQKIEIMWMVGFFLDNDTILRLGKIKTPPPGEFPGKPLYLPTSFQRIVRLYFQFCSARRTGDLLDFLPEPRSGFRSRFGNFLCKYQETRSSSGAVLVVNVF